MIQGNHKVVTENKKYSEFKVGAIVGVKMANKKDGLYTVNGKQYKARVLKGILSPIK